MSNYRVLVSSVTVMAFLAVWEIAPRAGLMDATFTSQPSRVIAAGLEIISTGGFLRDVSISLSEFAIGFALAIAVGVPLGLALGRFPVLRYLLDPPIMAYLLFDVLLVSLFGLTATSAVRALEGKLWTAGK